MKKSRIIAALALCLCFITPLLGCAEKPEENETPETNTIKIADFEQWEPDFGLMRVMPSFGKVSENRDENFAKSGKASRPYLRDSAMTVRTFPESSAWTCGCTTRKIRKCA